VFYVTTNPENTNQTTTILSLANAIPTFAIIQYAYVSFVFFAFPHFFNVREKTVCVFHTLCCVKKARVDIF